MLTCLTDFHYYSIDIHVFHDFHDFHYFHYFHYFFIIFTILASSISNSDSSTFFRLLLTTYLYPLIGLLYPAYPSCLLALSLSHSLTLSINW